MVAHCSWLSRLGHKLFTKLGVEFVVEEHTVYTNTKAELEEDLMSIIHIFSC